MLFAKPLAAAVFLTLNGLVLLAGERLRRRSIRRTEVAGHRDESGARLDTAITDSVRLAGRGRHRRAQILALFAGISRSGITMVAGLVRGLDHEDAAKFAFLLATPVILAAGVYKVPDLSGPLGNGIRGQVVAGSVAAFVAAFASARFLVRWFRTRTLVPFAVYCLVVGLASAVHFA